MNQELLKHYTTTATALQAVCTVAELQNHLQEIKQDPDVKSVEKRFIYDVLYYFNYNNSYAKAFELMKKYNVWNEDKIFTILKKAFYSVFGKNTFNFAA